jgi:hypothetical protein
VRLESKVIFVATDKERKSMIMGSVIVPELESDEHGEAADVKGHIGLSVGSKVNNQAARGPENCKMV